MQVSSEKKRICIGRIVAAHGVRGQMKLSSYTESPDNIRHYSHVIDDNGDPIDFVVTGKQKESIFLITIPGVTTRDQAEARKGTELFVYRDDLPEISEEEGFYHEDLVGLEVRDSQQQLLGRVSAVHNFGAGDIIDVRFSDGKEEMFSFDERTFPIVSVEEGYLTLQRPEEIIVQSESEHDNS